MSDGAEHLDLGLYLAVLPLLLPLCFVEDLMDGIQVHKVITVSESKGGSVWIYNTICTGYTWNPLTFTAHS
jgi:hypothetical protein